MGADGSVFLSVQVPGLRWFEAVQNCVGIGLPYRPNANADPGRQGLPEPVALRCHFEPLTGEVCIAGAETPDGGPLAALKDGKSACGGICTSC
jgi:hypothetical protein